MIIRFCLAAALLMPAAAMAQGNPGPFGQFFGRSPARVGEDSTTVDARSSVGGFYDSALFPPEGAIETETQTGFGGGASAGLSINHKSERFNAIASGAATRVEYFSPSYGVNQFGASAAIRSDLTTRLHGDASVSYSHSPFFSMYQSFGQIRSVDPNAPAVPVLPFGAQPLENETLDASAGLSAPVTENSRLTASAYRRQTMFTNSDDDFAMNGYRAGWTWQVGRGLGVRAGYGWEHSNQYGDQAQAFDNQIIDVGVDFTRSFSVARRTTFAFSTSSSILKQSTSASQLRINGGLVLTKYFRRTWQAAAYATRDTSFVPGFYEPLFSDSVGVSLGGMMTTRLEWMFYAGASRGESAFSKTTGFNSVAASSRLSVALNKYLGLYGQYFAYGYELPSNSNVLGLSQRLARQTVSVGLSAYVPIYNKVRR